MVGIGIVVDFFEFWVLEINIVCVVVVFYDKVFEIWKWEILVGYLFFDYIISSKLRVKFKGSFLEIVFKKVVVFMNVEEIMFLSVLLVVVKFILM